MVRPQDDEGTEVDSPLMAFLGDYRAHQVGTDAVKKYIAQRLKAGAANATVNRELAALKRIFLTLDPSRKDSPKAPYPDARRDNARPVFRARRLIAFRMPFRITQSRSSPSPITQAGAGAKFSISHGRKWTS